MHRMTTYSRQFDSTHWSVVMGAAAQDPGSRDSFARQYAPVVLAFLSARWRLPEEHERVQDAAQEVFVQCLREGGALDRVEPHRPGGFRAFLYGVVNNVALHSERARRRRLARVQPQSGYGTFDDPAHADESPSQAFDRAWAVMAVDEAYELMQTRSGELGRRRVAALRLRYEGGFSPAEIAARSAISVRRVYHLLETGRAQFRLYLLHVMAKYHPDEPEAELERRYRDLLGHL